MLYQKLSPRQNLAMTWWNRPGFEAYDGIILSLIHISEPTRLL